MSDSTQHKPNPFARFFTPDFMTQWTAQGAERFEMMLDQFEKWEARGAEQTESAVEDAAHLMRAGMDYSLDLQKAMRQQAMANTRQMLGYFGE